MIEVLEITTKIFTAFSFAIFILSFIILFGKSRDKEELQTKIIVVSISGIFSAYFILSTMHFQSS